MQAMSLNQPPKESLGHGGAVLSMTAVSDNVSQSPYTHTASLILIPKG